MKDLICMLKQIFADLHVFLKQGKIRNEINLDQPLVVRKKSTNGIRIYAHKAQQPETNLWFEVAGLVLRYKQALNQALK